LGHVCFVDFHELDVEIRS